MGINGRISVAVRSDCPDEISKAVSGDADALTALLLDLEPELRAVLEPEIAEQFHSALHVDDVIQITFLEAFLRICQFKTGGAGSFRAWILRIARNNLFDGVRELTRKRRPPRHRRIMIDDECNTHRDLLEQVASCDTTPTEAAVRVELKEDLDSAIARLPDDYRKVVRLIDLEMLSYTEAAKQLQRSTGAVYMLRSRAHERLAELLGSSSGSFVIQA